MVTKKCTQCERQADYGRSLCWHCTNIKKRYRMTDAEINAYRLELGSICFICERSMRGLRLVYGRAICRICMDVVQVMEMPGRIERVSNLINTNSVNDNRVETQSVTPTPDSNLAP